MKLIKAKIGGKYRVNIINLEKELSMRLETLGLTNGTFVEIINKKSYGAMVVKVRGSRFAIGKNIAEGIDVLEEVI
jgi:ferrous iron transport protein A